MTLLTALASLLSVWHSDSLPASWKIVRCLVSRGLSQGGGRGKRPKPSPCSVSLNLHKTPLGPAAVGRRWLGQAMGGNEVQPLLPVPCSPHPAPCCSPQECWAQELEAGVGCLAGLLAASGSLPLLLGLVTAWGVFHVFLAWKGSGVDSSRVLLGRGAPLESRRYTQGHQEKGKRGDRAS